LWSTRLLDVLSDDKYPDIAAACGFPDFKERMKSERKF
jgi:hypothetical protein